MDVARRDVRYGAIWQEAARNRFEFPIRLRVGLSLMAEQAGDGYLAAAMRGR